jgi:hypothetical protein
VPSHQTLLSLLLPSEARACPLCNTATADALRTSFSEVAGSPEVWLAIVLPFAGVLLLLRLLNLDRFDRGL